MTNGIFEPNKIIYLIFNFDRFISFLKANADIIFNKLHIDCPKVYSSEMNRMISSDYETFYNEADLEKAHNNAWLKSFLLVC